MYKTYFKVAARSLSRNKAFSFINISGLSIGMAAFLLIIHFVRYEKSYEDFIPNADNLYRVTLDLYNGSEYVVTDCETHPPFGPTIKSTMPEVKDFVRIQRMEQIREVSYQNEHFAEEKIYAADPAIFEVWGLQLTKGNVNSALRGPMQLVITESMEKKYFGKENSIGKSLQVKPYKERLEIVGVIKDIPSNTHLKMDFLISFSSLEKWGWNLNNWNGNNNYTYLQLAPGVDLEAFNAGLKSFSKKQFKKEILVAEPVKSIHLYSHKTFEPEVNGNAQTVNFLLLISILVLLIVSINYINLTTAKSVERAKEAGIRKIIGSSRASIIIQSIIEFVLINAIAVAIALVLVQARYPLYLEIIGKSIPMNMFQTVGFWQTVALLFLGNVILSGLYPAIVLSSTKPSAVSGRNFTSSPGGILLRRGLVVGQFAATFILLSGTIIVYQQVNYMKSQSLGMKTDQVMVVRAPAISNDDTLELQKVRVFKNMLSNNSGVAKISSCESLPGVSLHELSTQSGIVQYGREQRSGYNYYLYGIDTAFIPLMNIEMAAGLNFSAGSDVRNEVVINEEAARMLEFKDAKDAVGKKIALAMNNQPFVTVAGVVKNYHQQSLKEKHLPMILWYHKSASGYLALKVQTADLQHIIGEVKQAWNSTLPGYNFDYYFLDEMFDQQYKADLQFGKTTAVFSGIAIFLACLGLLGLISYTIHKRAKEIGIRKVLGASVAGITVLLSKEYVRLILISIIIASPIAYFGMRNWLQDYEYRIDLNHNWWIFLTAGIIALLIALITVSFQAIKAAIANPVNSLRSE